MSTIRSYRDLQVWQKGMELVVAVYHLARQIPPDERFGLGAQLRRSAVSIPSNLAEGHARSTRGDFLRFVRYSLGSLAELETQLEVVCRLELASSSQVEQTTALAREVGKMLTGLRIRLATSPRRSSPSP